ncbi:S-adenosyl-L-methionine-dependent methyltransferase, partial [Aureobasidium melanogenum]
MTARNSGSSSSFPEYFKKLSSAYSRQTGDSTFNLIYSFLQHLPADVILSEQSIVHDNAAGPGTATIAAMSVLQKEPAKIVVTDFTQGMIDNIQLRIDQEQWKNITASVMDSHELALPDNTFTLTICNVSTSTFKDSLKCMQEILRTLQPGGVCINSQWKRFTVKDIIHKAQISIRPDSKLFNMPKAEFLNDGVLRDLMLEAGFAKADQYVETTIITDDAIEGLREFMCGNFTASARGGWTEEEAAKWPAAIDAAIEEEKANYGGIKMEAWMVVARKAGSRVGGRYCAI